MTPSNQIHYQFSPALQSAIEENRSICLLHWRLAPNRIDSKDYLPIFLGAGYLDRYLHLIHREYHHSSQLHQSNHAIRNAQLHYLKLYVQGQITNKEDATRHQSKLWYRYGRDLKYKTFSRYLWQITQPGHLLLFVEALPNQFHFLLGFAAQQPEPPAWIWTDLTQTETGQLLPMTAHLSFQAHS